MKRAALFVAALVASLLALFYFLGRNAQAAPLPLLTPPPPAPTPNGPAPSPATSSGPSVATVVASLATAAVAKVAGTAAASALSSGASAIAAGAGASTAAVAATAVGVVGVAALFTHNIIGMVDSLWGDNTPPEPQRRAALTIHMDSLLNTGLADVYGHLGAHPAVSNADDKTQVAAADAWIAAAQAIVDAAVSKKDLDFLARQKLLDSVRSGGQSSDTRAYRRTQVER